MTIELDPNDPLFDTGPPVKTPRRIPRSTEAFAKTPWSALASRCNDDAFPPLTRLCLYLQIRSRQGQWAVPLNNGELLDLGISRWQKGRLVCRLEKSGRIAVERRIGRYPIITVLRPWW